MQFTTLLVIASLATNVIAYPIYAVSNTTIILGKRNLHKLASCLNKDLGDPKKEVYNNDATTKSCQNYKNRNNGKAKWESCADCNPSTGSYESPAKCLSQTGHIGGDEWEQYCKNNGGSRGVAE